MNNIRTTNYLAVINLIVFSIILPNKLLASTCDGVEVHDDSDYEKTLSFNRPIIADKYDGYINYIIAIDDKGNTLTQGYDEIVLKDRVLNYSKNKCAPKQIGLRA